MSGVNLQELATELYDAHFKAERIAVPPSARDADFDLNAAYAVEAELIKRRKEAGHVPAGRKIGMPNKAMWRKLGLSTLIWGTVYDDTLVYAKNSSADFPLKGTIAPKIEAEIVFKLKAPLTSGANDAAAVLEAVEWVALGYEIVDCPYPDWQFKPVDFVSTFGFHAGLIVGEPLAVTKDNLAELVEQLPTLKLRLFKNGELVEEGTGKNILGSPALSLGELAEALTRQAGVTTLTAGEVITTGSVTTPALIAAGEEWRTEVEGIALPPLTANFS